MGERTPRGQWIPGPTRRLMVKAFNRWLAFKAARERSVKNIGLANDRAAFERIYRSPALVAEYLAPERLEFYERVVDYCAPFEAHTIVDVGCGTGQLLAAFARRTTAVRLVGIDHTAAGIALLRDAVPSATCIVADIYSVSLPERFDLVLCTEVLEHLHRPGAAIEQLLALGSPVVVTVPDGELDSYAGHVNFWTFEEFSALLNDHGRADVERLDSETLVGVIQRYG